MALRESDKQDEREKENLHHVGVIKRIYSAAGCPAPVVASAEAAAAGARTIELRAWRPASPAAAGAP